MERDRRAGDRHEVVAHLFLVSEAQTRDRERGHENHESEPLAHA
jgi:hypothetical protein